MRIDFALTPLATAVSGEPWFIYAAMPLFAALIGWSTKLVMIRMLFRPLEFVGVGPVGWQGVVPRRTPKFASMAADTLLDDLIDAREMLGRIDPERLVAEIEQPMLELVDDVAREIAARYHAEAWARLPEPVRQLVVARVRARAADAVRNILEDVAADIDHAFDPRPITVVNLVRNRALMNRLFYEIATPELRFMVKMGAIFGGVIGVVQALALAATNSHLVIPMFGGFTGLVTDWLALKMIFVPRTPKRLLFLRWQGLFFKRRTQISEAYARIGTHDLLNPRMIMDGLLQGPVADRVFALVAREVDRALQAEVGRGRPLVELAIGSRRYRDLKHTMVARLRARVPDLTDRIAQHAEETLQAEETVRDAMLRMDADQYEGILRPIFKDDEWLVIAVGAVLGFIVGELQVLLITHL